MKVVSKNEKLISGTNRKDREKKSEEGIDKMPPPDRSLSDYARKIYHKVGKRLLETGKIQAVDQYNLELLATSLEMYYQCTTKINEMNERTPVSGYVQVFATGATNVTGYVSAREKATDTILKISKLFGLNIRDRQAIATVGDPNQGEIDFEEFRSMANG